jgi:protein phosphatase
MIWGTMIPRQPQAYSAPPEFFSAVDVGRCRSNNEDAVAIDEELALAVLADGMGGYNAGEVASELATSRIHSLYGAWLRRHGRQAANAELLRALDACVLETNRAIYDAGSADPSCAGMGTTLVVALLRDDRLLVGHVGDSRAYRLRGATLQQITHDHSVMQEQIDAGLISAEQAAISGRRNLVTRALGVEDSVRLEAHLHEVEPGDIYLLCSDGLSDMLEDDAIARLLLRHDGLADAGRALVDAANQAGGRDNISLILVRVNSDGGPERHRWPYRR